MVDVVGEGWVRVEGEVEWACVGVRREVEVVTMIKAVIYDFVRPIRFTKELPRKFCFGWRLLRIGGCRRVFVVASPLQMRHK